HKQRKIADRLELADKSVARSVYTCLEGRHGWEVSGDRIAGNVGKEVGINRDACAVVETGSSQGADEVECRRGSTGIDARDKRITAAKCARSEWSNVRAGEAARRPAGDASITRAIGGNGCADIVGSSAEVREVNNRDGRAGGWIVQAGQEC